MVATLQFSDFVIFVAYMVISVVLVWTMYRMKIQFKFVHLGFASFIFLCGLTHFMDFLMAYWPVYNLLMAMKLLTAVVSAAIALAMLPITESLLLYHQSATQGKKDRETEGGDIRKVGS